MLQNRYELGGKVALVTGGGSGIGRACAIEFGRGGAVVAVADRNAEGAAETVQLISQGGASAHAFTTDVTDEEAVGKLFSQLQAQYKRLDCAVNAAGMVGETIETAKQPLSAFDKVMAVNVRGIFICMQGELRMMLSGSGGVIVNVASLAGLMGFSNTSPYAASKHAVVGLTRAAALEYVTRGIRVNALCPGLIKTPLFDSWRDSGGWAAATDEMMAAATPAKRLGTPEEVAALAMWLCSPDASFVTGQPIAVCGALSAGKGD